MIHGLVWGSTGTGKTNLMATFARGLWLEQKKKTRLVSVQRKQSEGLFRQGIDEGYILPWWLDALMDADGSPVTPFERMKDAVLGDWPLDLSNPRSTLVKAFSIRYLAKCDQAEKHPDKKEVLVYQSDKAPMQAGNLKCPKCGQACTVGTERVLSDKRLEEVGAYIFEDLSEMGELLMRSMSVRAAKGEQLGGGDRGGVSVRFQDGDMWIAGSTMASYDISQRQMKNRVDESAHLPVDYVLWTAGREDGKDDTRGNVVIQGPKLPGNKKTADIPRWFGPTLGACVAPITNDGKELREYRLYLNSYYQTWIPIIAKVENLCNSRIPARALKGVPDFYKIAPEDEQALWTIIRMIEKKQRGG